MRWLILLIPFHIFAAELALDVGYSANNARADRLAVQLPLNIEYFENNDGSFIYHETSLNYFNSEEDSTRKVAGISWSPVYSSRLAEGNRWSIQWEVGIGISYFGNDKIDKRDLSTHFLFEDRLGLKLYFGHGYKQAISLRFFHYSNAHIKQPNHGLDILTLGYSQSF